MKFRRGLVAAAIIALPALTYGQELYQLTFSGTARYMNDRGRLGVQRLTARDLIARCVGTNAVATNAFDTVIGYQLVYNRSNKTVQVVNATNGALVCDVLQFETGFAHTDGRRSDRLDFVFVPELTTAVGTASISENLNRRDNRVSILGQAVFLLTSLEPGSANNPPPLISTNQNNGTNASGQLSIPGVPSSPGTILDTTNSSESTNISSGPVLPTPGATTNVNTAPAPGTLLDVTNSTSTTNNSLVPGLPPTPVLSTTNNNLLSPNINVPPPPAPGTLLDSTNSVGGTNLASGPALPPTAVLSSPVSSVNSAVTIQQLPISLLSSTNGVELLGLTNGVICSGRFSSTRKFVPGNGQ